jgi:hypothetical protein
VVKNRYDFISLIKKAVIAGMTFKKIRNKKAGDIHQP